MLEQYYDKNGWDQYVKSNELEGANEYIKSFTNIKYIGHGGTCIAFTNNDTQNQSVVIKVCLKKRMTFVSVGKMQEPFQEINTTSCGTTTIFTLNVFMM